MPAGRLAIRLGLILLGTTWAGLLAVGGIKLVLGGLSGRPWNENLALWAGIALIAAGEYVFMFSVADRVCQLSRRRIADAVQLCCAVIFVGASGYCGVLFVMGAGS